MITTTKAALRKEMFAKRDAISEAEQKEKSKAIAEKLFALDEFKSAKIIAFYLSKGSEVETFEMIAEVIEHGKEVLVPVTNDEMEFMKFTSFDDLAPAKFGVPEPKTKIPATREPDVVIVPGVAFDLDLHRLGYGNGYYDRALKKLPNAIRIGICFDFQIVERIPRHEHDERLHKVVNEKRIIAPE